jgi:hypothetical protein
MFLKINSDTFLNTSRIVSIEIIEPMEHEQYGPIPNGYSVVFVTDLLEDKVEESYENEDILSTGDSLVRSKYNYMCYIHPKIFSSFGEAESWILENVPDIIISSKREIH